MPEQSPQQSPQESPPRSPKLNPAEGNNRANASQSLGPYDGPNLFFGPDGLRSCWCLLFFLAIGFFVYLLSGSMLISARAVHLILRENAGKPATLLTLIVNDLPLLLAVVVATSIMSLLERRPISSYGLGGRRRISNLFAGLAWGAGLLSLFLVFLWTGGWLVFDGRILTGGEIPKRAAVWILGFAIVSLTEEYTMRGYLQFTLTRVFSSIYGLGMGASRSRTLGFWTSAVFLSFLFGAGHGSNPGESPIGLVSAGLIGLIFCLTLWRTGSLWWALGFHASWDWAQSFLFGVADSGAMVQGHLLATHPTGKLLLSGGATGPEGSLFILPLLLLVTGVVMLIPKERTLSIAH